MFRSASPHLTVHSLVAITVGIANHDNAGCFFFNISPKKVSSRLKQNLPQKPSGRQQPFPDSGTSSFIFVHLFFCLSIILKKTYTKFHVVYELFECNLLILHSFITFTAWSSKSLFTQHLTIDAFSCSMYF